MKKCRRRALCYSTIRQYSADQVEFLKAMDRYKVEHNRPYPEWWEVLAVFKSLGYRKVESPDEFTEKDLEGISKEEGVGMSLVCELQGGQTFNEEAAWRYLYALFTANREYGICQAISRMNKEGFIDQPTWQKMRDRVLAERKKVGRECWGSGYIWDPDDYRARARFCLQVVRTIQREGASK